MVCVDPIIKVANTSTGCNRLASLTVVGVLLFEPKRETQMNTYGKKRGVNSVLKGATF